MYLRFGLMTFEVSVIPALEAAADDVSFKQLCPCHEQPIQQKRVCATTGDEVPYEDLVKGALTGEDSYTVVDQKALDAIAETTKIDVMNVDGFVDQAALPNTVVNSYFLKAKNKASAEALAVLALALQETGKAAVTKFTLKSRQYLGAITTNPVTGAVEMQTLAFASQRRQPDQAILSHIDVDVPDATLALAVELVDALGEVDLESYTDDVAEAKAKAVAEALAGKPVSVKKAATPKSSGGSLSALEASLAAVKGKSAKKAA
jgi:DNA end-binding protein Ku